MNVVKNIGKGMDKLLKHKNLRLVLILMVTIYSALLAPALPNSIIRFFDTVLGKLLFVFLIGFMASKNVQVALVIAIGFIVTLQIVERKKIENYINFIEAFKEGADDSSTEDTGDSGDTNDRHHNKCEKTITEAKVHMNNIHRACTTKEKKEVGSDNADTEIEGFSFE